MKFDVVRASDYEQGRQGADAPCPVKGAQYNLEESRWELEVTTLEQLMKLANEEAEGPIVLHGTDENGVGMLEIYDIADDDMGCGDPACNNCNPPALDPHALS